MPNQRRVSSPRMPRTRPLPTQSSRACTAFVSLVDHGCAASVAPPAARREGSRLRLMIPSTTTGPPIADPPGRPQRERRLGGLTAAGSARPVRAREGRVSVTRGRIGARDLVVLEGTVDVRGVAWLLDVLQRVAGAGEPPALDLCRAGVPDAADVALVVHVVRWVCRRRPGLTIVCPPGPTRTALER